MHACAEELDAGDLQGHECRRSMAQHEDQDELARLRAENAGLKVLVESEERIRLALAAGRIGTWQYLPASGVVTFSPRIEEIFGLPIGSFKGTLEAYGECIHPDDRANMSATLQRVLMPNAAVDSFHAVHRSAGAEVRWVECYGRVWRDAQARVMRMAGTVVDVTDQRRLEAQLARGQRLEAIGRLAGGIAHDFNNVLTAIVGSADLCLLAPHQLREHVALIHESAARAARLVEQLLTFSKRQEAERKVLDLGQVVLDLDGLLRRLAGERVRLTFAVSPDVHRVHADQGQLEQVLMNLVANARDALPRGGHIQVKLDACVEGAEEFACLVVEDDGVGMSQAVIDQAFDPFFTTKETGTGLGLATCYGIVGKLGGSIGIESSEGKGTRIRVLIPRSRAELSDAGIEVEAVSKRGSETILLVDDDAMVRTVARDLLVSSGYLVLAADGAEQALQTARAHDGTLDLLLTDVAMPKMSGVALAVAMQKLRPNTAVLLMSGYSGDAFERDETEAARALPFLSKPFTLKELLARVREVLDARAGAHA